MQTPGRIVTFYSYKGGTGRSMVLANVAWLLAAAGRRVLAIDWDLEAPGLHRYFHPFLMDPEVGGSEGLIDFVVDYQLRTYVPPGREPPLPGDTGEETAVEEGGGAAAAGAAAGGDLREHAERVLRCIQSLDWEFPGEGTLDFIPAGQQSAGYAACVNSFNWSDFYRTDRGEELFREVRELLRSEYDYVLIDSRTGVSDTSGICTVQMPDAVVVCFTLNNQGIHGAAGIARSIVEQRRERPIDVFPVPMRVENAEKEKLESRKAFARRQFERIHFALPPGESRTSYWNAVLFPYVPYYAYEEILATFGDRSADATSLLAPAMRLASYLDGGGGEFTFPFPSEEVRADVLARYARDSVVAMASTPAQRAREAEETYLRLNSEDREAAYRVFTRLVQVAGHGEGADTWVSVPLAALSEVERRAMRHFHGSALRVTARDGGGEVVQAADEGLLTAWPRLHEWTVQDREFLLWRRRLGASLSEWIDGDEDDDDLLSGARIFAARRWLEQRRDRLTGPERAFIGRSLARHRARRLVTLAQRSAALAALVLVVVLGWVSTSRARLLDARTRQLESSYRTRLDSVQVAGLLRSGEDNRQLGNYERALADFRAAATLDGANAAPFFGLGYTSYQRGDYVASVEALSEAVERDTAHWRAYEIRALALLESGDTTRAVADLQQVLARAPNDVRQVRGAQLAGLSGNRTVVDSTVRVNIRYRSREDQELAGRVRRELGRVGFIVLSVEFREEDSTAPVRYFFAEDQRQAELVAERVQTALREADVETRVDARQFRNFRNLPRGRIEVWLPIFTVEK